METLNSAFFLQNSLLIDIKNPNLFVVSRSTLQYSNTPILRVVCPGIVESYAGLSNQEIGKLFGGMHYSAVSKSSARFEKEMAGNRRSSTLVNGLMSKVKT